jgi:hypothetical protein
MPIIFTEIAKPVTDILLHNYAIQAHKFTLKTKTSNNIELTTESSLQDSKYVYGQLSFCFSPINNIHVKKVSMTSEGRLQTESNFEHKGLSYTVKTENGAGIPSATELVVDFKNKNTAVRASIDVKGLSGPKLYGSSTFIYNKFLFGLEANMNVGINMNGCSTDIADYNVALGYMTDQSGATILTKNKGKEVTLNLHHHYSNDIMLASEYSHSNKVLTAGALYNIDPNLKVQGKLDSNGFVSANAIQTIASGIKLITSVNIDAKRYADTDASKFGLSLVID